ncbi:hypothetical protein ACT1UH_02910 [Mycoplasma sp. 332]|uniref:hypothetical protein n=1 Tax=Mycoplasma sp. 332 TaxID=3458236 RepID=UPI004035A5B1
MRKNNKKIESKSDMNNSLSAKPKKNIKKLLTTIFMYSGIIASIGVISGVSIFYSTNQSRSVNYLYDSERDVKFEKSERSENNTISTFVLEKEIPASELFDLDKKVEISNQNGEYGVHLLTNYSFYKTGYNLDSYFDNKKFVFALDKNSDKEIAVVKLQDEFKKFKDKNKYDIDFKYFIQQLTSLKLAISYYFTMNNKTFFIENKKNVTGFEIKTLFSKIHEYFRNVVAKKEIKNEDFIFKINVINKNGIIDKVKFLVKFSFETIESKNDSKQEKKN